MAEIKNSSSDVSSLPFVADRAADSKRPWKRRDFWAIPGSIGHDEAHRLGSRWAAEWLEYAKEGAPLSLWAVVDDMIDHTAGMAWDDNRRSIAVSFVNTIEQYALVGAKVAIPPREFVEGQIAHYAKLENERLEERHARGLAAVARMNAARMAKRAGHHSASVKEA